MWFDMARNNEKATHDQLELLCSVLDLELDDLLDSIVTQGDVVRMLREHLGQDRIPDHVLFRRQQQRAERQALPKCRICEREGDSTKHHFVNKWILRELEGYVQKWADRSKNCIPVCIDCHRDLHNRNNGPVSIADKLDADEKAFVEAALTALSEQRPKLLILIARGDDSVYEARLVKDWFEGKFATEDAAEVEEPHRLRSVA